MECRVMMSTVFLTSTLLVVSCWSQQFENVAFEKECNMSSIRPQVRNCTGAVNGNTNSTYSNTNCIQTDDNYTVEWWEVKLGQHFIVHSIAIWPRNRRVMQLHGSIITVDGEECTTLNTRSLEPNDRVNATCDNGALNGTVVRITKNVTANNPLTFCEFQVLITVCEDGYWGSGCTRNCGKCNNSEVCDKVTGHCSSCSAGWEPLLCADCEDGYWGNSCTEKCGDCSDGQVCNKVTGHCTTCSPGLKPHSCVSVCDDGNWGNGCEEECGDCANNEVCDKVTGHCTNCSLGLILPFCRAEDTSDEKESGPIIGTVIGTVVVVAVIVVVVILVIRRKSRHGTNADADVVDTRGITNTVAAAVPDRADFQTSRETPTEDAEQTNQVSMEGSYIELMDNPSVYDRLATYRSQHIYVGVQNS